MNESVENITNRLMLLKKYYNSNIEDEIILMWAMDLLENFNLEEIIVAIKSYKMNETYPPTLAGIIKYMPEVKTDYAQLILEAVRKCGVGSERAIDLLKGDEVALDLYNRYGNRVGMSEPYSTSQKFLFKEINDEAQQVYRFNKTTLTTLQELKHEDQILLSEMEGNEDDESM